MQLCKVDIKLIEPEVTYKAGVDVMMMRAASYWSGLGSSKNRTHVGLESPISIKTFILSQESFWYNLRRII
jgi:hypothetical protein